MFRNAKIRRALLTNCGAGIVIRIQVKLEPGRGASGHLAAEGHAARYLLPVRGTGQD